MVKVIWLEYGLERGWEIGEGILGKFREGCCCKEETLRRCTITDQWER